MTVTFAAVLAMIIVEGLSGVDAGRSHPRTGMLPDPSGASSLIVWIKIAANLCALGSRS
jgi:hypothetical protein